MRVVVSLTTIPSRLPQLRQILQSLRRQTRKPDAIYLNLPFHFRHRTLGSLPQTPSFLDAFPEVTVLRCEDFGPATKLLPVLKRETSPETLLVTADDDTVYPPEWLHHLAEAANRLPDCALAYRGRQFVRHGNKVLYWHSRVVACHTLRRAIPVEILTGTWGCAYRRRFFDDQVFAMDQLPTAMLCDDLWFSGHLARRKVRRLVIPFPVPMAQTGAAEELNPLYPLSQQKTYPDQTIAHFAPYWIHRWKTDANAGWGLWRRKILNFWYLRPQALPEVSRLSSGIQSLLGLLRSR